MFRISIGHLSETNAGIYKIEPPRNKYINGKKNIQSTVKTC
jgi:hypothetical protein